MHCSRSGLFFFFLFSRLSLCLRFKTSRHTSWVLPCKERERVDFFCFIFKQLRGKITTATGLRSIKACSWRHVCASLKMKKKSDTRLWSLQILRAEKFYSTDENVAKPPYIMSKNLLKKQKDDEKSKAARHLRANLGRGRHRVVPLNNLEHSSK